MRIGDWSSDVCSSDLFHRRGVGTKDVEARPVGDQLDLHRLALLLVILVNIGEVVQRQVHLGRIVVVDLDNQTVLRLGIAGPGPARKAEDDKDGKTEADGGRSEGRRGGTGGGETGRVRGWGILTKKTQKNTEH